VNNSIHRRESKPETKISKKFMKRGNSIRIEELTVDSVFEDKKHFNLAIWRKCLHDLITSPETHD
jgi:hypothetical protein